MSPSFRHKLEALFEERARLPAGLPASSVSTASALTGPAKLRSSPSSRRIAALSRRSWFAAAYSPRAPVRTPAPNSARARSAVRGWRRRQREQIGQAPGALGQMLPQLPVAPERDSHAQAPVTLPLSFRSVERGAQVVVLAVEALRASPLVGPAETSGRPVLGQHQ